MENGRFSVDSVYYVNGYIKGFPIKSPVIDIVEVGSGGGSIAWLDEQNRLHVGPQSAGSTPGPVCYGRGGTEPTVTDANLLLGRLNPDHFLGGELRLDTDGAWAALSEKICASLGYEGEGGVIRMADGIISIATVIMASAIRKVSIEHGRDPRDFVMFAYGGGGPLHGSALAHELSIPMLVIPPEPGNFSAVGMLLADARIDASETFVGVLDEDILSKLNNVFSEMEVEARKALKDEFDADDIVFERQAEMRFQGQRHNIKVALPDLFDEDVLNEAFLRDYERRYGHADLETEIEIQVLHLSATARLKRPEIAHLPREGVKARPVHKRPVYFGNLGKAVETPVYERTALVPGLKQPVRPLSRSTALPQSFGQAIGSRSAPCRKSVSIVRGLVRICLDWRQVGDGLYERSKLTSKRRTR